MNTLYKVLREQYPHPMKSRNTAKGTPENPVYCIGGALDNFYREVYGQDIPLENFPGRLTIATRLLMTDNEPFTRRHQGFFWYLAIAEAIIAHNEREEFEKGWALIAACFPEK